MPGRCSSVKDVGCALGGNSLDWCTQFASAWAESPGLEDVWQRFQSIEQPAEL